MYIEQIYCGCLSKAAYFIESNGEAAIIDPLRDTGSYVKLAKKHKAAFKYIFETQIHSDFISDHLELRKKTDAQIVFGPTMDTRFNFHLAKDGEIIKIGNLTIEAIHTPGHTLESTCYLLRDETGKPHSIFTSDTLLIDEAGKPDLSSGNLSGQELAALIYHSIQNKLISLPDDLIVYPAHLSGRSTGSNIPAKMYSTIGDQKKENISLRIQPMEEFIAVITKDLNDIPGNFAFNIKMNKEGYSPLKNIMNKGLVSLKIKEFKEKNNQKCIILDTRNSTEFTEGFIPGSVSIGLDGRFEECAGNVLPFDHSVLLVTEHGKEEESITRLARVGFEKVEGYLQGGFEEWKSSGEAIDLIIDIEADELAMDLPFDDNLMVVDVRTQYEFAEGHVKDSTNIPLKDLTDLAQIASLEEDQNIYVHSGEGYSSVIAASLLKRQGYHNLRNVLGGWNKIKEQENIPTEKSGEVLN